MRECASAKVGARFVNEEGKEIIHKEHKEMRFLGKKLVVKNGVRLV